MDLIFLRLNGAPPKECLENALAQLNKDIRDAVERVLYETKLEKIQGELPGRWIDIRREHEKYRERAATGLKEYRRYCDRISAPSVEPLRWLDDAIKNFDALKLPGPYRRTKEGRHHQPWTNKAHRRLKQLQVPKDLAEELLLACGIRQQHRSEHE
jgi:hypothetical protein